MKTKLIDLLVLIANNNLEDKTKIIIDDVLYVYDKKSKKLLCGYDNSKCRTIHTYALDIDIQVL